MNTMHKNQPSNSDKRNRPNRVVDGLGRGLVCCALIWGLGLLVVTVQGIHRPAPTSTKPIAKLSLDDLVNGHWKFAELPWNVATREMTAQEVDAALASESAFDLESASSDDSAYSFLQMLDPIVQKDLGKTIYRYDSPSLRIVGFASAKRPKSIQEIRVVMRNSPPQWTYLQAIRAEASAAPQEEDLPHLLPATGTGNRLATRVNSRNEVQAEFFDLTARLVDVRNVWLEQGWNVRDLEEENNGNPVLFCQKETEAIVACVVGSSKQDPGMLLTVRSPSF